jgi:hypothetical protein
MSPRIITNRGYISLVILAAETKLNADNSKKLATVVHTRAVNCFYQALLFLIPDTPYTSS